MPYTTILADVKISLGITGNYHDNAIQDYIDEVKQFLLDAGVDQTIVDSIWAKGIITRGVADLWNYGAGGTKLSPYFYQRATQLVLKSSGETKPSILADLTNRVENLEKSAIVVEGDADE